MSTYFEISGFLFRILDYVLFLCVYWFVYVYDITWACCFPNENSTLTVIANQNSTWIQIRIHFMRRGFFILFYSLRCFYVSFVIIAMATRIKHTNTHTAQMTIHNRVTETNHWHLYIGNDGERQRWVFCSRFSTHFKCFSWTNMRKMLFWCRLFVGLFWMKCYFPGCF